MSDDKKINIVSGDGKDLDISPVYEHIEIEKPKKEDKKDIVIPKVKKDSNKKENKND